MPNFFAIFVAMFLYVSFRSYVGQYRPQQLGRSNLCNCSPPIMRSEIWLVIDFIFRCDLKIIKFDLSIFRVRLLAQNPSAVHFEHLQTSERSFKYAAILTHVAYEYFSVSIIPPSLFVITYPSSITLCFHNLYKYWLCHMKCPDFGNDNKDVQRGQNCEACGKKREKSILNGK